MAVKVASLCAGYGGLELGLTLAGVDHELEWYAEIDPIAARVMAAHHPTAENLGDVTEIADCPKVDIVTAGWPCQPVSMAGKGEAQNDVRWIIDDVCRVARAAGARWLVLENVKGLLATSRRDAMARVAAALAFFGFGRWEGGTFRASGVGACHERERWFCIATDTERVGWETRPGPSTSSPTRFRWNGSDDGHRAPDLKLLPTPTASDARSSGSAGYSTASGRHSGVTLTDAVVRGFVEWSEYALSIERHRVIMGKPEPHPKPAGNLSPEFVEWMMMLPAGHVTDHVVKKSDALRILGNGVVPLCAALGISTLSQRFG